MLEFRNQFTEQVHKLSLHPHARGTHPLNLGGKPGELVSIAERLILDDADALKTLTMSLLGAGGLATIILLWLLVRFESNRWEVYF